jgi:hypothetical protein
MRVHFSTLPSQGMQEHITCKPGTSRQYRGFNASHLTCHSINPETLWIIVSDRPFDGNGYGSTIPPEWRFGKQADQEN